jgi:short-subunit dehydrogenase
MSTIDVREKHRALITGASAGIGQEFARQLARDGYDLVLVARDAARLDELAKELESERGVQAEVLAADLTKDDQITGVEARIAADPPVDLVINNAGFGTFGAFHELPRDGEDREVRLNVLAVLRLSHAAAAAMVPRGTGAIINVSSLAGVQPIPYNATYAATKAFVTNFSEALHEELRGTGVHVEVLCPGFTRTEFQERAGYEPSRVPSFAWSTSEDVVTAALDALKKRRAVCVPGTFNKVTNLLSGSTPHAISRRVAGSLVGH